MRCILGLTLLAMLAAAPAAVLAQQPMPLPRAETAAPAHGAKQGAAVGFLLQHRAELGLTDQQISRLQQIAQRLEQQNQPLLQQLRDAGIPVRPERREGVRDMTPEQRQQLRQRMEAHRPTLMQMRENTRTAMEEARGVLTSEQQQRMREIARESAPELRDKRQGPNQPPPRGPRGNR
jgi:hypothetical protein